MICAVPHVVTAVPLIMIGAFMMGPCGGIDWGNLREALPAFLTITVVPFSYSIHNGILAGLLLDTYFAIVGWLCRVEDNKEEMHQSEPAACKEVQEAALAVDELRRILSSTAGSGGAAGDLESGSSPATSTKASSCEIPPQEGLQCNSAEHVMVRSVLFCSTDSPPTAILISDSGPTA
jgi:hypothetical protein